MDDDDKLGPGSIYYLASIVADGTATPEDARRLLVEFVRQADTDPHGIDPRLILHLRDCIAAFLNGRKVLDPAPGRGRTEVKGALMPTLDKAFGIKREAAGGPPTDEDTLAEVSMGVLQRRLVGDSLEDAAAFVAEARKSRKAPVASDTRVRDAWAKHQMDGFLMLRVIKAQRGETWTPSEIARLDEIFKKKVWYAPSHLDAKARFDAIRAELDRPDADAADVKERVAAVIARFDGIGAPKNSRKSRA